MIGALAGDIIGSRFEFNNNKSTEFDLFTKECFFTDDSVLTIAIADCILSGKPVAKTLKEYFRSYPDRGYGGMFRQWALSDVIEPYESFGNGAAMRISPVGFAYDSLDLVLLKAKEFTRATHNHPEGIKGAQATASAIFMARKKQSKKEIRKLISMVYGYDLSRTLDEIRPDYQFNETCQATVPEAITAFLESTSFEDAIRKAVSLGGDSDTLACITGGIAQAYYGVPIEIQNQVLKRFPLALSSIIKNFSERYCKT